MKKLFYFLLLFSNMLFVCAQDNKNYPQGVRNLLAAYPSSIKGYNGTSIVMHDDSEIKYTQSHKTAHPDLINSNNLGDMFYYLYPKGTVANIPKNHDAGRIRNEELLNKMYGSTAGEVQKKLVTIVWCPKLINRKLRVTSINGVDKQLQKVSDELDKHPELKDYLQSAGVYNRRFIKGTKRLSAHSFGTAIDIAVKHADYWQWNCRCTTEDTNLKYKNRIPQLIVDIFEKHGFIWGGKWYHYDTMHFEYRPELLVDEKEPF